MPKGQIAWNKGKKLSKEHVENARKNRIGKGKKERIVKKCPICGTIMELLPCRDKTFCSKRCAGKGSNAKYPSRKGENNSNWRGGTTILRYLIWSSYKYFNWRLDIFKKYDFTCQHCGIKKELQVHHNPYEFSDILKDFKIKNLNDAYICKELWDIENGIVLCKNCHKKTYKFKGNQYVGEEKDGQKS